MLYAIVGFKGARARALAAAAKEADCSVAELLTGIVEDAMERRPDRFPPVPAPETAPGLDGVVSTYLQMRDTKTTLNRDATIAEADIKAHMMKVEMFLLSKLNADGVQSVRTKAATFFKTEVIKPSCADWGAFYEFVKENDAFEFLEKRVSKTPVEAYMKEHGSPPPGVNALREYTVTIRRGNNG